MDGQQQKSILVCSKQCSTLTLLTFRRLLKHLHCSFY